MAGEILDNKGRGDAHWSWPTVHPEGRKFALITAAASLVCAFLAWETIAWPLAFVTLGIQFIVGAIGREGMIINILIGLMFVVMGGLPLWYTIRGGAQPFLIGLASVHGRLFSYRDTGRKSFFAPARSAEGETVPPTPRDWVLALGIVAVAMPLGVWLSVLAFNAVGASG